MVTSSTLAAFSQRPSIPSVLRRALPTRAESNLMRIASGARLTDVYRDETRSWWSLAEQGLVDKAVADPRFGDFVTVMQLCTDLGLEEVGAERVEY